MGDETRTVIFWIPGFLFSQYVRGLGSMSVEQAVHKLTHDVARIWGIKDRGLLKPGYAADLVLFDPDTIDRGPEIAVHDLPAPGFRFIRRAEGVREVFVNGRSASRADTGYSGGRSGAVVAWEA